MSLSLLIDGLLHKPKPRRVDDRLAIVQLAPLGDACELMIFCRTLEAAGCEFDVYCRQSLAGLWRRFFPQAGVVGLASRKAWRGFSSDIDYAAAVSTSITGESARVLLRLRARRRIVMRESDEHNLRRLFDGVYLAAPHEHVQSRYGGLLALAGCAGRPAPPLTTEPGDFILLHPGGKWPPRRWPLDRYLQLGKRLVAAGHAARLLVHESETDILAALPEGCVTPPIITRSVDDLYNAVAGCQVFAGNDSGPLHLATLLGKPSLGLWGPGDLDRIAPQGEHVKLIVKPCELRPCRQYRPVCEKGENRCLLSIEVDEVLNELHNMM